MSALASHNEIPFEQMQANEGTGVGVDHPRSFYVLEPVRLRDDLERRYGLASIARIRTMQATFSKSVSVAPASAILAAEII